MDERRAVASVLNNLKGNVDEDVLPKLN